MRNPKAFVGLAVLGVALFAGGTFATYKAGYLPNTPGWWARIGQEEVRKILIDPDSAKFSDVKSPSAGLACGNVNARNSYGGYTGRTGFVWRKGEGARLNPGQPDMRAYLATMSDMAGSRAFEEKATAAHEAAANWCRYARAEAICIGGSKEYRAEIEKTCGWLDEMYQLVTG